MWPFMAPFDMGVNIDLSCGRTPNPDMVLDSSLDLVVFIVPSDSKGHPGQDGPSSSLDR